MSVPCNVQYADYGGWLCVHNKNDSEGYGTAMHVCSRVNDPRAGARKFCISMFLACTGKVW